MTVPFYQLSWTELREQFPTASEELLGNIADSIGDLLSDRFSDACADLGTFTTFQQQTQTLPMSELSITCPICGQEDAIGFYEGVENGAPHGAGYWPMSVSEINQECDCSISEDQMTDLANKAWEPFRKQDDAYAAELAELYADTLDA